MCWDNWGFTCKKDEVGPLYPTTHKYSFKMVIHVHVRDKTIKLLGENIGVNLGDHGLG